MIKKINIALAVVFAVLFGFKLLLDFAESAKASRHRRVAAPTVSSEASTLAPHVYFRRWEPLFAPNLITKHNGFCLDLIKEIFPEAILDGTKDTMHVEAVRELLLSDPKAVIADYGDMKELEEFPVAQEQVVCVALCVYTPRTSDWSYKGADSLDQLRLGWTVDFNDSPVLRAFAEKWKDTPGKVVISDTMTDEGTYFWELIEKGELDGFVDSCGYIMNSSEQNDAKTFVRYRSSKPIDMVKIRFRASNLDPEWAKNVCQAFDDGVHRLYHSGFIHRLAEYYRKDMISKGNGDFYIPLDEYGEDR